MLMLRHLGVHHTYTYEQFQPYLVCCHDRCTLLTKYSPVLRQVYLRDRRSQFIDKRRLSFVSAASFGLNIYCFVVDRRILRFASTLTRQPM